MLFYFVIRSTPADQQICKPTWNKTQIELSQSPELILVKLRYSCFSFA